MSGSPKYSTVRIRADIAARLAREAKEAELRRREVLELKAQLSRDKTFARLTAELKEITSGPSPTEEWVSFFNQNEAALLRQKFESMVAAQSDRISASSLGDVEKLGFEVRQKWRQLTMHARDRCLQAKLLANESTVDAAESLLASVSVRDSKKFDAKGEAQSNDLLKQTRKALKRGDAEASSKLSRDLWQAVEAHINTTLQRKGTWELARDHAANQRDDLARRVESLSSDPAVQLWKGPDLELSAGKLNQLHELFQQEHFAEVLKCSDKLTADLDNLEAEALTADLKERRRQHVVSSMSLVLHQMGFKVSENPRSDPAADVVINAQRLTGGVVSVSVPQEGELLYDLAGFERSQIVGSNGKTATICDDAEALIDDFHAQLSSVCGVEAGPLRWDDQDPNRIAKTAKIIPTGGVSKSSEY